MLMTNFTSDSRSQGDGRESTYETDVLLLYEGPAEKLLLDLSQMPSPAVCRDRCLKNPKCQAWIYITDKASKPEARRMCFQYAGSESGRQKVASGQVISGLVFSRADRVSTYEFDVLYDYEGAAMDFIIDITPQPSPEGCRDMCLKNPRCHTWVYFTDKIPVTKLRRHCGNYSGPGSSRTVMAPGMVISGRVSDEGGKATQKK
jgi:hypothetical protein